VRVFRDDAGDEGVICKVHRQFEPHLEAHKDPRPRIEDLVTRCWGFGVGNSRQARLETCMYHLKHPVSDRGGHKSRTSGVGSNSQTHAKQVSFSPLSSCRVDRFLRQTRSDQSSSRATASTGHNAMRQNVTVVASRRPRAQDQGKGS
jgi:hypothetical protein